MRLNIKKGATMGPSKVTELFGQVFLSVLFEPSF